MVAIVAARAEVEELRVEGAQIANVNHPRQMVVSGASEAVEQVARASEARGWKTVRLAVSHGFHSSVFDTLDLDAVVDGLTLRDLQVPIASCIDAAPYADARGGPLGVPAARHLAGALRRHLGRARRAPRARRRHLRQGPCAGGPSGPVREFAAEGNAAVRSRSPPSTTTTAALVPPRARRAFRARRRCRLRPVTTSRRPWRLVARGLPKQRYWLISERTKALKLAGIEPKAARASEPPARAAAAAEEPAVEPAPANGGRADVISDVVRRRRARLGLPARRAARLDDADGRSRV